MGSSRLYSKWISTHAPAGGATLSSEAILAMPHISTHAPAGGATRPGERGVDDGKEFLLTPLREGRPDMQSAAPGRWSISTHAPAGGATRSMARLSLPQLFLLTPLREGRHFTKCRAQSRWNFYSRPCGRGDQLCALYGKEAFNFYSRPCGRGDTWIGVGLAKSLEISTHAPAGGATVKDIAILRELILISTHAPAGGATIRNAGLIRDGDLFLLTPLREGRRGTRSAGGHKKNFYSRPCGRGDSNFPQVRHEVLRQIAER